MHCIELYKLSRWFKSLRNTILRCSGVKSMPTNLPLKPSDRDPTQSGCARHLPSRDQPTSTAFLLCSTTTTRPPTTRISPSIPIALKVDIHLHPRAQPRYPVQQMAITASAHLARLHLRTQPDAPSEQVPTVRSCGTREDRTGACWMRVSCSVEREVAPVSHHTVASTSP